MTTRQALAEARRRWGSDGRVECKTRIPRFNTPEAQAAIKRAQNARPLIKRMREAFNATNRDRAMDRLPRFIKKYRQRLAEQLKMTAKPTKANMTRHVIRLWDQIDKHLADARALGLWCEQMGMVHPSRRCTVGEIWGIRAFPMFLIKGSGDTWEEAFDNATAR